MRDWWLRRLPTLDAVYDGRLSCGLAAVDCSIDKVGSPPSNQEKEGKLEGRKTTEGPEYGRAGQGDPEREAVWTTDQLGQYRRL